MGVYLDQEEFHFLRHFHIVFMMIIFELPHLKQGLVIPLPKVVSRSESKDCKFTMIDFLYGHCCCKIFQYLFSKL